MSASLFARGMGARKHYGFAPIGGGSAPTYPAVTAIYFNTTAIIIKWQNPGPGLYNAYQLQVSLFPDFSTVGYDSSMTIADNSASFVDSLGNNDSRRYWRWRGSSNSGTTAGPWSRVYSYWLNTTGAQSISIPRNSWMLINPSDVTDRYTFQMFPMYKTLQQHQYRVRVRNRQGTMLTEYVTLKAAIQFVFDQTRWLSPTEFSETRRFNETIKTFFLALNNDYVLGEPVANIWKVQFETDPDVAMFNPGRQDLLVGNLIFTEV